MGRGKFVKKPFTLLVVILVLLLGCAGLNLNESNLRAMKFGSVSYTMPLAVPDFTSWIGTPSRILVSPRLCIKRWFASNPNNVDENILMLVAAENRGHPYIIVIVHTLSMKFDKHLFYADKQYLLTGKPSFILSLVAEPPDIEKFITMKQLQFIPKVEI